MKTRFTEEQVIGLIDVIEGLLRIFAPREGETDNFARKTVLRLSK